MTINSFNIRPPRDVELRAVETWFGSSILGWKQCLARVAFSQPGDVPLGGVIVRPALGGNVGQFTIYVRPDCRRRGIGRRLMQSLYQLALSNNAGHLVMSELVHQDKPENAFFRALSMSPDMQLGSYELDIAGQVSPLCERIVGRMQSHPHLRDTRVTTLEHADPEAVARFITYHFSGFVDQQIERIRRGYFDRTLSTVAARSDGSITGVALFVALPNDPAILLDLVLTESTVRNGPTPLALFAEAARRCPAMGKTRVVFEADPAKDAFAINFAAQCGVKSPAWFRYRYTIDREGMKANVPQ